MAHNFRVVTVTAVVMCALYSAIVFLSRGRGTRAVTSTTQPQSQSRSAADTGTGLRILGFYANKAVAIRGEDALICYSVQEARKIQIEPPVGEVWPAFGRCVAVQPKQDTTYTLTAEGNDGRRISSTFTLPVAPPPAEITLLAATEEIRPGDPFAFCYGVRNAVGVVLQPTGQVLAPSPKHCIRGFIPRTTKFELIATGEDGKQARGTVTVAVKPN